MKNDTWNDIIDLLQREVVPATGCTEPASAALAGAVAAKYLGTTPHHIVIKVSGNLMKNAMGVEIPSTGMKGIAAAVAIGITGGNADKGLEVLSALQPHHLKQAKALLGRDAISLSVIKGGEPVYIEVTLQADDQVRVVISGSHNRITLIERNGKPLFNADEPAVWQAVLKPISLSFYEIYRFATQVPIERIQFMLSAVDLNRTLSREGMQGAYGLNIGTTLQQQINKGLLADDMMNRVMLQTAAASDARMGGAPLPAMSNSGSGNQGITATLPVVAVAQQTAADEEQLCRAVTLSHLFAIYIKQKLPTLSAMCSATTAGMGATAAICWLLGGNFTHISNSVRLMVGDVSGILCDGAGSGCALKVSTSASAALKAAMVSLNSQTLAAQEGFSTEDIEETVANLAGIVQKGLPQADREIIQMMEYKAEQLGSAQSPN